MKEIHLLLLALVVAVGFVLCAYLLTWLGGWLLEKLLLRGYGLSKEDAKNWEDEVE